MMKYLRYSNFKISIDINPFSWRFKLLLEPGVYYLRILPLTFLLVIDNGEAPAILGLTK